MNISDIVTVVLFLVHLYKVKVGLCDTPGAGPCALAYALVRACDQNVQFLRSGQFLNNYKG